MRLTPEQKQSVKKMLHFLVTKKSEQSAGHCGFHLMDLSEYLKELQDEGKIIGRKTLHSTRYFLEKNHN